MIQYGSIESASKALFKNIATAIAGDMPGDARETQAGVPGPACRGHLVPAGHTPSNRVPAGPRAALSGRSHL
jgi:hypothetical protein